MLRVVERSETERSKENQAKKLLDLSLLIKCLYLSRQKVVIMKHLTKEQRYQISAYLVCEKPKGFIADAIGVNRSTIYREIERNSTKTGKYSPSFAQELAEEKKRQVC